MTRTVLLGDIMIEPSRNGLTKPKRVRGSGVKMVNMGELFANARIKDLAMDRVPLSDREKVTLLKPYDLLFARQSLVLEGAGQCSIFISDDEEVCFESHIIRVRIDSDKADPRFIFYWFLSPIGKHAIRSKVEQGAGAAGIRGSDLRNVRIELPDLVTQKRIANVLEAIDEKIELNRKINKTLEQIGQALFRHYFIDNPEAEKWKDGVVSDLVAIYSGYAFKSTDFDSDGKYGLVTIKNVQDGNFLTTCSDYLLKVPTKVPDYVHLKSGDTLLSLTGNVGRVCIAYGEKLLLNQRVAKLAGVHSHNSFAYFMFRQDDFKAKLISISRGTAQLNLSPIETKKINIKLPPENILEEFYLEAEPIIKTITENCQQIQTLTSLRDTLLPRLINGKISL